MKLVFMVMVATSVLGVISLITDMQNMINICVCV